MSILGSSMVSEFICKIRLEATCLQPYKKTYY